MADEIDWNEEIAAFDANLANTECRIMWGKLARAILRAALGGDGD